VTIMDINDTQYTQLSEDVRHYDNQLYIIPTTLLAILSLGFQQAVQWPDGVRKIGVLAFLVVVCDGYATLFAKLSIHQRACRRALTRLDDAIKNAVTVERTTWDDAGQMHKIDRTTYKKYSPLWIYFPSSADRTIMQMIMLAFFGTVAYTVKTVLVFFYPRYVYAPVLSLFLSMVISTVFWWLRAGRASALKSFP